MKERKNNHPYEKAENERAWKRHLPQDVLVAFVKETVVGSVQFVPRLYAVFQTSFFADWFIIFQNHPYFLS